MDEKFWPMTGHVAAGSLMLVSPEFAEQVVATDYRDEIRRFAGKSATLEDVHVAGMVVANSAPVSFFARFTPDALTQVAAQLPGRPVMMEHNYDDPGGPVGRFFAAKRVFLPPTARAPREDSYAVQALFYMARDGRGDDIMKRIKLGVYSEASLGWLPADHDCSICKADMMTPDCPHWPGEIYEQGGLATMDMSGVIDVLEASIVYAGAARGTKLFVPDAARAAAAAFAAGERPRFKGGEPEYRSASAARPEGLRRRIAAVSFSKDRFETQPEAEREARNLYFRVDRASQSDDAFVFEQKALSAAAAPSLATVKVKAGISATYVKPVEEDRRNRAVASMADMFGGAA